MEVARRKLDEQSVEGKEDQTVYLLIHVLNRCWGPSARGRWSERKFSLIEYLALVSPYIPFATSGTCVKVPICRWNDLQAYKVVNVEKHATWGYDAPVLRWPIHWRRHVRMRCAELEPRDFNII